MAGCIARIFSPAAAARSRPDRAATAHEKLREALERFFDRRGAWPPDECADETLDRLALKLGSGQQIDDLRATRAIAPVLLEWRRHPHPVAIGERMTRAEWPARPVEETAHEGLMVCFDRCLAALTAESRNLVLAYYVAERREKIDNRRRLARALGLSENALRSRVQRVRDRLERCVQTYRGLSMTATRDVSQLRRYVLGGSTEEEAAATEREHFRGWRRSGSRPRGRKRPDRRARLGRARGGRT